MSGTLPPLALTLGDFYRDGRRSGFNFPDCVTVPGPQGQGRVGLGCSVPADLSVSGATPYRAVAFAPGGSRVRLFATARLSDVWTGEGRRRASEQLPCRLARNRLRFVTSASSNAFGRSRSFSSASSLARVRRFELDDGARR
jgi:hypothetical protein